MTSSILDSRRTDPRAELPRPNFKYVKECIELYLAYRGLTTLDGFEAFANLEALWVNNNELDRLQGLDACFRIKCLYAHCNRISSLEGSSLPVMRFLRELRLFHNRLHDLPATLAVLAKLQHLEDLDLFGNPLAEEANYRLLVIHSVPSLQVLDRHVITSDERAHAARLRCSHENDCSAKSGGVKAPRTKKAAVIAGALPDALSGTAKLLMREVKQIRREQKIRDQEALERSQLEAVQRARAATVIQPLQRSSNNHSSISGLDDADVKAVERHFRDLEATRDSGIPKEKVTALLQFLTSRGVAILLDGKQVDLDADRETDESKDLRDVTDRLFPQNGSTVIKLETLLQAFTSRGVTCQYLPPSQLHARARKLFARCDSLQRRLLSGMVDDAAASELSHEMHILSQQAYHLDTLAERIEGVAAAAATTVKSLPVVDAREEKSTPHESPSTSTPKTRFYLPSFKRNTVVPRIFHELKSQCDQVAPQLAAKYKLHGKDMTKYLVQRAPSVNTLVRRRLDL